MSRVSPIEQVFVSVERAASLVGGSDQLGDLALRGRLGFYVQVHEPSARSIDAQPWNIGSKPLPVPEVPSRTRSAPLHEGDDSRFKIDGWFRASRSMVYELLSMQGESVHECVDAWDEQSGCWRVLTTQSRRRFEEMWLLYAELSEAGFVQEQPRLLDDAALDPRERKSLLLIIGALAKMAGVDRRGAAVAVSKYMTDELFLRSPQEATVRKCLKEAADVLEDHLSKSAIGNPKPQ